MADQGDYVFLMKDNVPHPLPSHPYKEGLLGRELEDALQTLIERNPKILPGKQMDPGSEDPPRFVFLRREMPISGQSLDLLLADQRGILTLVETKLIQNPESRREVVGQIIEYAANAIQSWGNGRAREKAAEFWSRKGRNLDDVIREGFEDAEIDIDAFWRSVEENLNDRNLRLIIAADQLRPEVRRIVEYLNQEMENTEVYGLELQCYGDEKASLVLVPRLIGQTQATAERKKKETSPRAKPFTDLFEYLKSKFDEAHPDFLANIPPRAPYIQFKKTERSGSIHYEIMLGNTISVDFHFEKTEEREVFRGKIKSHVPKIERAMAGLKYNESWPRFTFKTKYSQNDDLYDEELKRDLLKTLDEVIKAVEPTLKELGY